MATSLTAAITIDAKTTLSPDGPITGDKRGDLTGTSRWKDGTGSGQVDRRYREDATLGAGATDSYNLLAAGGLTDDENQAIDLDELKMLAIKCTAGEITIEAPVANGLSIFKAAEDGIVLASGQRFGLDLGAAGIDVTTNSKFDVTDSGGGGSTYSIVFAGAQ